MNTDKTTAGRVPIAPGHLEETMPQPIDHDSMQVAVARYTDRVRWFCTAIAENPDSNESIEIYPAVIAQEAAFLAAEGAAAYLRYLEQLGQHEAPLMERDPSRLEPSELVLEYLSNWGPAAGAGDDEAFPWTDGDAPRFLEFLAQLNPHTRIRWDAARAELGITNRQLLGLAVAEAVVAWTADL